MATENPDLGTSDEPIGIGRVSDGKDEVAMALQGGM